MPSYPNSKANVDMVTAGRKPTTSGSKEIAKADRRDDPSLLELDQALLGHFGHEFGPSGGNADRRGQPCSRTRTSSICDRGTQIWSAVDVFQAPWTISRLATS